MKRWLTGVCVATLAGCAEPRISVTDASPRRIEFLVQDARSVPVRDMDKQAASHCRRHGLSYRQTDAVWTSPTLKRITYECRPAKPPLKRRPEPRRMAVQAPPATAAKPVSKDPRAVAWAKVKAATDAWALCLRLDAERRAQETTEAPQSVAREAVGCLLRIGACGAGAAEGGGRGFKPLPGGPPCAGCPGCAEHGGKRQGRHRRAGFRSSRVAATSVTRRCLLTHW